MLCSTNCAWCKVYFGMLTFPHEWRVYQQISALLFSTRTTRSSSCGSIYCKLCWNVPQPRPPHTQGLTQPGSLPNPKPELLTVCNAIYTLWLQHGKKDRARGQSQAADRGSVPGRLTFFDPLLCAERQGEKFTQRNTWEEKEGPESHFGQTKSQQGSSEEWAVRTQSEKAGGEKFTGVFALLHPLPLSFSLSLSALSSPCLSPKQKAFV